MKTPPTAHEACAVARSANAETSTLIAHEHPTMTLDEWRERINEQVGGALLTFAYVIDRESSDGVSQCSSVRWEEINRYGYDAEDNAFVIATADLVTEGLCSALKALGYNTRHMSQKVRDIDTPSNEDPDIYRSEIVIDWSQPAEVPEVTG
ncbi:hypothetical protein KC973_03695 [Candidatus Saccharibacteria bacterium]|nr:hypothetical protein [Candidatus Saccharibacteria bacterium]